MVKRNIEETIEKANFNKHFFISTNEVLSLSKRESIYDAIITAFQFGYAQGSKATKSEIKKKGALVYGK